MDGGMREVNSAELAVVGEESGSLPSGTVTFLFTDIEGSTRLLERLRDQYAQVLAEQRELLREVFQRWRGHEVDTQGDAFFVAFGRATDAIACTVEAQQCLAGHDWPHGVNVRVRMGLHTGEPLVAKTGYVGMDVHRAARIAAVGHGGQVLLSQTTRDLVCVALPSGTRLRDLGAHMLKDISYPQEIYQLEILGLPAEFPPLKSLDKLEKEEEPPAPGKSPYMGLQYFDEEDAEWFFGRQAVTERLVEAVDSQRFLAVIGASGSGKSSVVRAGLVPAMKTRCPPDWQVRVITPSSHPLEALAICLTWGSESVTATATLIDDLQNDPRSLHLFCQKNLRHRKDTRILLVIDQFEELFTLCRSEAERLALVKNLLYAVNAPEGAVTTVITLRADFYEHLAQYTALREQVSAHQVYIGAMNASELRAAIKEPAFRGGWEFSPGLVDLILSDLGAGEGREPEPGALPLLSHAMLETWKRRRGNLLNLKAYTEAGGVRGAIAKTAESVFYGDLTPDQQVIARDIFLRLTELGEGTQDTRRRISIHELIPPGPAVEAEQIYTVLSKLADARLIITGEKTVEVAHEALIREWPTLHEWLAADREGLRLHRHLTEAAQEWELLERDAGALYRGTRLNQAVEWAMANPRSLSAMEQDFLEASRQAAEREQAEREAQRQRELEAAHKLAETERQRAEEQGQSARSLRRRAYLLGGVLALALILAAAAGVFGQQADANAKLANQNLATAQSAEQSALGQQATAENERLRAEAEAQQRATAEASAEQERKIAQDSARLATSRELTSAALNNLKLDSQLSAYLVLQAFQTYPSIETENALHRVLPELRMSKNTMGSFQISNSVISHRIVRDGQLLIGVLGQALGGIIVVDRASGNILSTLTQDENCSFIEATRDGRWVAARCVWLGQNFIHVWETEKGKLLFTFPDLGIEPESFDTAIIISKNRVILLEGVKQTSDPIRFGLIPPSPTHSLLAYGCDENTKMDVMETHIWEVSSGKEVFVFRDHSRTPELGQSFVDLAASSDGKRVATYGSDGRVILWDMETGRKLLQFDPYSKGIGNAVFSPDGTHLATWGQDNTIKIWDLTSLSPGPRLELTISHAITLLPVLMYSPDGTRLAAGGVDGLVRVWDAQTGELQITLSGHESWSLVLSFNQDGTRLYTTSYDGTIKEWYISASRELLTLPGRIGSAAFSPDGTKLALTGEDGSLSIVDSRTGEVLRKWQAHSDWIEDIAWSPDRLRLATSNGLSPFGPASDNTTKIWDAATGQLLKELPGDTVEGFFRVIWSPDGRRLVTASSQAGAILIWDTASWELLKTLPKQGMTWDVAYSPDGKKIAASVQQDIAVWDAGTGNQVFTYHTGLIGFGLAFSPDGQRLAVGLSNGSILLLKMTESEAVKERTLAAGDKQLNTIAISPDGTLLASGDTAGKVRVWDLTTMQMRLELANFTEPIIRVTFSPDSRRLVASSVSGTSYFYVLPTDELAALIRAHIIRPLKVEECQKYLHTEKCLPSTVRP